MGSDGAAAHLVLAVNIGPVGKQQIDRLLATFTCSKVKCSSPAIILAMDVSPMG
eukprot:m.154388 g.154388  ORF g.154388 m.154388 type:complete len:54 (-) comp10190_c0_seq1:849-1010(-)